VKETRRSFFIDRDYCTKCKACYYACPVNAVKIIRKMYERLEEELKIPSEQLEVIEMRRRTALRDILESRPYDVVSVGKNNTIADAVHIMTEKNISGVFVVDENNKLVRLFTERDIVRCVFSATSFDEKLENIPMRDITSFDPSTEISSAIAIASREKIRHLPVVEGDMIVGMITYRDLVSYLLPEICYMSETTY
jgi:CBS domain-containing protein